MVLVCSNETSDDDVIASQHPVVVTDDVFLRQRIFNHGGLVMTFHQLWIFLAEVQEAIDKEEQHLIDEERVSQ